MLPGDVRKTVRSRTGTDSPAHGEVFAAQILQSGISQIGIGDRQIGISRTPLVAAAGVDISAQIARGAVIESVREQQGGLRGLKEERRGTNCDQHQTGEFHKFRLRLF